MTTQLATRGATWGIRVDLVVEHCCNCAMPFAMPRTVHEELLEHSTASPNPTKTFYCPAGHPQQYTGKTAEQKLREEKESLERRLKWAREHGEQIRERALKAERSASALRGVVTRTKKRVGNGVCPCCNRTFESLARHMASKHPDYRDDDAPAARLAWPASTSTVRAWARASDLPVSTRGRIPDAVREAYRQAVEAQPPVEPGACGRPDCAVLHEDPERPIHPPWDTP